MSTAVSPGAEAPLSSPPPARGKPYGSVSRSQSSRSRPPSSNSGGAATATAAMSSSRAPSQHHHHTAAHHYGSGSVGGNTSGNGYDADAPGGHHRRSSSKEVRHAPPSAAPVESASRPHRHASQRSARQPSTHAPPSADNSTSDRADRADRTERSERSERSERTERSGRSERTERAERSEKTEKTEKPEKTSDKADTKSSRQTKSRTTIPTPSGKWLLGKVIGAGSMGKVRLATKEDSNEVVACKIIPRGSTDDNHLSRAERERADQSKEIRTAREAAIVTLLDHPYICGLRDVVRTNHHWYMLFEYVNGGQMLDYIIAHGKLKEKPARKFSRQIASALDYCHRNSIVHRDLKIENILISKTGDIKIIDFGLSNLFAPRGHLKTFCGSLYFAAPELLQARVYTGPEVDIWSFGIVLYVLVCGKVPFDDQSIPALHSKIKKGVVDYPNWLSAECKHLLSRMLVTDPRARATMTEVLNHAWMTKGYSGPPDNYLPRREPLSLPLDQAVINDMTGFNFGPPNVIKEQLTRIIESDEYQRNAHLLMKERDLPQAPKDAEKRRGFNLDFYKRRNSANSRDALTAPSVEGLPLGNDPLNAYSPLISVYYLAREKRERDQQELLATAPPPKEKVSSVPEIAPPQEAHVNTNTYEMPGERPTGGRTRPRSRTHGEDEIQEAKGKATAAAAAAGLLSPPGGQDGHHLETPRKESTAAGILRRLSTRRRPRESERPEKDRSHPPVVQVHSPVEMNQPTPTVPRKSFSIRRTRQDRDNGSTPRLRSGSSQPQHSDLLSPPMSAGDNNNNGYKKGLGRSTSVSSAEFSRRRPIGGSASRIAKEPPPTSGSENSTANDKLPGGNMHSRSVSLRAKPLGHARRESIQARRQRLEEERSREANVPEETDGEVGEQSGVSNERLADFDLDRPVYLKGLFSVSTTSTKPVREIRADIKRVLKQLGVDYVEIKGGFSCRHAPSIDLNKVPEMPNSPTATGGGGHRRRFSFGALRSGERDRDDIRDTLERGPSTPRTPAVPSGRGGAGGADYSNSDVSEDSEPRMGRGDSSRRVMAAGETTTHVRSDMGGNMVLEFEIFIVKVPMISIHGIQFKRLSGNTWQYKNMADHILRELRLFLSRANALSSTREESRPFPHAPCRSFPAATQPNSPPSSTVSDPQRPEYSFAEPSLSAGLLAEDAVAVDPRRPWTAFSATPVPRDAVPGENISSSNAFRNVVGAGPSSGVVAPQDCDRDAVEVEQIEQIEACGLVVHPAAIRPRQRLPPPQYPASGSDYGDVEDDQPPSPFDLQEETKRPGQSSHTSGNSYESEPPPAYEEGSSPLQSFTYLMAAAGGANSIITQVQQGGPPINNLSNDVGIDETIAMDLRGTRFVLSRDELLTLPEFVLLSLFPNGLFPEGHMGGFGEGDAIQVDYDPASLQYMLDFFRGVAQSIPTDMPSAQPDGGEVGAIDPLAGRDDASKRAGIIVLREDLDFYAIPPRANMGQAEMIEVKRAAARALLKQNGIFSGLKRSDEPGTTEAHLIEMLTAGGFDHDDAWGHRAGEPNKAVICSLALARLRSDIRGNEMSSNAVGMAQKLLLFWRKPARRCWWEGVDLENVDGVEGTLKVWIRRVWTLEMSVIGLR